VPDRAPIRLSAESARRIALAAQGFGAPRPERPPDARRLMWLVRRLGLLQLDSVNVLVRAHYLPAFSRVGPYDRELLDRLAGHGPGARAERRLAEYWGHEASLVPFQTLALLRWRMAAVDEFAWGGIRRIARERPELVREVRRLVAESGPIRAAQIPSSRAQRRPGVMWDWHEGKQALEYLFYTGEITAAARVNFERRYDLTERVVPAEVLRSPTPARPDAQRELVRIAARALGIATEPDLGDYFRLPRADSRARIAELLSAGELLPASVEGWSAPALLWPRARRPRSISARALLSPFDPLIWFRPRTERLFGFRYRIEIYTPRSRRVYGYYVLPFLLGDRLVARVDLKADRSQRILRVQAAHPEPGVEHQLVARELAEELSTLARWLGLEKVKVAGRGELSGALSDALRS
jgi:uncharacterized protein YcaQ